jgi:hypothetical protein
MCVYFLTCADSPKILRIYSLLFVDELAELMGGKQPACMLRDFLDAKCPTLA